MESSATIGPPGHGDTLAAMGILKRRSHQWVDARSLELARAIAAKVAAEPPYLDRARATLARWKQNRTSWPSALQECEDLLAKASFETVLALLTEDSEEGCRRRRSSPFTGILTEKERREVFSKYEKIGA
jgi:hypothetical protein